MTGSKKKEKERKVALALIAIGLIGIPLSFLLYRTPDAIPITHTDEVVYPATYVTYQGYNRSIPSVHFFLDLDIEAQGGFDAGNTITVKAIIRYANATTGMYYCWFGFTDADYSNNTNGALFRIRPSNSSQYFTSGGQIEYSQAGKSWAFILPCGPVGSNQWWLPDNNHTSYAKGPFDIEVGPISNTINWQNGQTQLRLLIAGVFWTPFLGFEAVKRGIGL